MKSKLKSFGLFLTIVILLLAVFLFMVKKNVGNLASDVLAPAIGDIPVVKQILPIKKYQKVKQVPSSSNPTVLSAASEPMASSDSSQVAASQAASSQSAVSDQGITAPSTSPDVQAKKAAQARKRAARRKQKQAQLDDYAATYSKMDPKAAAVIFDNMVPADLNLVSKILKNIPANKRAAILEQMDVNNASKITAKFGK